MICKYCHDEGSIDLIESPCHCTNQVHLRCLLRWFTTSHTTHCPECLYDNLSRYWVMGVFLLSEVCYSFLELCDSLFST